MEPSPIYRPAPATLTEAPLTPPMKAALLADAVRQRGVCFGAAVTSVLLAWLVPALMGAEQVPVIFVLVGVLGLCVGGMLAWTGIWIVQDASHDVDSALCQQATGPMSTEMRVHRSDEHHVVYDYLLRSGGHCFKVSPSAFRHARLLTSGTILCVMHQEFIIEILDEVGWVV
jgi:hypothetical protein